MNRTVRHQVHSYRIVSYRTVVVNTCALCNITKLIITLSVGFITCEVNCQGVWPNKISTDDYFTRWVDHR